MIVTVPPVEEQIRIRDRLDTDTDRLKSLGRTINKSITRLREFRTALISAAVTGKIDVHDESQEACA